MSKSASASQRLMALSESKKLRHADEAAMKRVMVLAGPMRLDRLSTHHEAIVQVSMRPYLDLGVIVFGDEELSRDIRRNFERYLSEAPWLREIVAPTGEVDEMTINCVADLLVAIRSNERRFE